LEARWWWLLAGVVLPIIQTSEARVALQRPALVISRIPEVTVPTDPEGTPQVAVAVQVLRTLVGAPSALQLAPVATMVAAMAAQGAPMLAVAIMALLLAAAAEEDEEEDY